MIAWLIKLFQREQLENKREITKQKLKEIFNPKSETINLTPLKVYVLDEKYSLTNLKNLNKFLFKDLTNYQKYVKEVSDCDDFAIRLWAKFKKLYPNFAFGFAISSSHAFNVFIDDKLKIWIVEPQDDQVFEYKKGNKYKLKMVII